MGIVKSLLRTVHPQRPLPTVRIDGLVVADLLAPDAGELGGKGEGLRSLAQAGLPVLPTRVIPAEVERRWRKRGMPSSWRSALITAARQLGPRLAVRSSALEEDGERSYAGVHATILGVPPEQVPDAVIRVWQSLGAASARAYGPASAMAVLLQPQIDPDAAGVLFTVNPQNGSWREMVLEAVHGQGEALVSGRAAPQWAVFRRPRDAGRRSRVRRISEERVPQPFRWALEDGELAPVPLPEEQQTLPVLPPATQLLLCRLGLRAERAFGEPVDVEWSWHHGSLTLLQARPITHTGSPRVRDVLWTRRFLGERFPVPPTPFSWSLLAPILDHFIAYPGVQERYLGGGTATRLVDGYPYLNVTVFRHLLFKWPGAPAPEFMLELIPPDEASAWRRRFAVRADWAVYRAIFETTFDERRWERFAWNPFTNHRVWEDFEAGFRRSIEELEDPIDSVEQGLERLDRYRDLITEYLSIHVCSLLFANLWYQLLDGALGAWMGPGDWLARLAVCPPGNHTLRTNEALWELGQHASEADRERLGRGEAEGAFAVHLEGFKAAFGHRAENSWEIFSPRWRDAPEQLAPLLPRGGASPAERAAELERTFQSTREDVLEAVQGWRQRVLDGLIFLTRRYLLLRENQRFLFDRLTAGLQATLLQLEERGIEQIRWRTVQELTTPVALEELARRKQRREEQLGRTPPVFLRGDAPIASSHTGNKLEGLGISPGRIQGTVRIIGSLEEGERLAEGEILVASAVDPGWTPLLLRAGGLVLELGSLLSHGAVIAREYGVPGVVNVDIAALRDGERVTVDGTRGLVWLER